MSRFSLFPHVGEVNAWIEATVRAAGTGHFATDYRRGVRGHGLRALANTYQLPIPTVQHVVARATRPSRTAWTQEE